MPSSNPPPLVSVCIPVYRGATHLTATIDSVLSQSFSNFELLIIDDNSPDETASIVARYSDPRIRFLRNTHNLGAEGNWNRCLEEARGKYFKLLPQDDVLAPDCLARQVAVLDADIQQNIALVFCARNIIDASGRFIMSRGYPGSAGNNSGHLVIRKSVRRGTNLVGEPGGVMFPKILADKVGPFASIGYVVDIDYWSRLLLLGDAYYIPDKLVSFRVSNESWSVAIGRGQSNAFRGFIDRVASFPDYNLSQLDVISGNLMARVNNVLRLLIYRVLPK